MFGRPPLGGKNPPYRVGIACVRAKPVHGFGGKRDQRSGVQQLRRALDLFGGDSDHCRICLRFSTGSAASSTPVPPDLVEFKSLRRGGRGARAIFTHFPGIFE
jgi:hypothetical protein